MFWLKDPQLGTKSVTITAFIYGLVVCVAKLLLSGLTIKGLHIPTFSGSEFAIAVGALGAIYTARRTFPGPNGTTKESDTQ